jgi:hypothetical protein
LQTDTNTARKVVVSTEEQVMVEVAVEVEVMGAPETKIGTTGSTEARAWMETRRR